MYYEKEGFDWDRYETVPELLRCACKRYAKDVLFAWKKGRKLVEKTYAQWKEDVLLLAGRMKSLKETHIGIICDYSYESILSIFAVIVAGKIVIPLESFQSRAFYENCIGMADIELIMYRGSALEENEKPNNCKLIQFQEMEALEGETLSSWPEWEKERPACIFFSSGTTGAKKKCVLLSQLNIATSNALFGGPYKLKVQTQTLLVLPLYHVLSFIGVLSCINGGYKIYIGKGPKYLAVELIEYHPDFILSVPMINEVLMKGIQKGIKAEGKEKAVKVAIGFTRLLFQFGIDIRPAVFREIYEKLGGRLRVLIVGGAPHREKVIDYFQDFGIYVLNGYGMTETTSVVSQNTFCKTRSGSVGIILPYNEVKIVEGEIWIRGDNVMLGYYKDEDATKLAMEDGWLKTGDLGYIDEDGYLFLTGRKKNLIILSNGVNVSPEEIEQELLKSDVIQEVVVCEKDEHIHAVVYPGERKEAEYGAGEIEEIILKYNQNHSVYQRIVSWEMRDRPFEKTASLKIKRGEKR